MSTNIETIEYFYQSGNKMLVKLCINGELPHNPDGPARQTWYETGQLKSETYCNYGYWHNINGPANQEWYENGQLKITQYCKLGKLHNLYGPSYQMWDESGNLIKKQFHIEYIEYLSLEDLLLAAKLTCLK